MACTITISGRAFPCKTGIGGIKHIYVAAWSDDMWEAIGATTAGVVDDAASAVTLYKFEVAKNSGSMEQTINSSIENGNVYFTQVVTAVMPLLDAASNAAMYELIKGRTAVVVEDEYKASDK